MDFSQETCWNLIEEYENRPILWRVTHEYYYKIKKEDAGREISQIFHKDVGEIQKKIDSLKGSYRRQKSKVKKNVGTEKGTDEVYVSKWFAYDSFRFLGERDEPRKTVNSLRADDSNSPEGDVEALQNTDSSVLLEEIEAQPEVIHRSQQTKVFKSPKHLHPVKRKRSETDPRVALAFDYLQTAAAAFSTPNEPKDECTTFGDYVATEIRKLEHKLRGDAKHRISSVIFEIEMRRYNDRGPGDTSFAPIAQSAHRAATELTPSPQFSPHFSYFQLNPLNPYNTHTPMRRESYSNFFALSPFELSQPSQLTPMRIASQPQSFTSLSEPSQSSQFTHKTLTSYQQFSAHFPTETAQSLQHNPTLSRASTPQSSRYNSDSNLTSYFETYDCETGPSK